MTMLRTPLLHSKHYKLLLCLAFRSSYLNNIVARSKVSDGYRSLVFFLCLLSPLLHQSALHVEDHPGHLVEGIVSV